MKKDIRYEQVMCDCEDISFIKIGRMDRKFEWLLGSIYINCNGIRREENEKYMHMINSVVNKAKFEGLKILFGGDMNAHIWELDRCENGNGRLLKQFAGDLGLQIMNCVWKGMSGATWFMVDMEFTLYDDVCIDREGIACVVEALILDEVNVVYSDHAAGSVSTEWNIKKKSKGNKIKYRVCKYEKELG